MMYADVIKSLYDLRWFGAKLGLENTFKLAELAGNPQNRLRFVHVAGTNGKGSTCAMLESIYRASGLRVGLFTSPHLVSFRERIQVNRQLINEKTVVRLVGEMKPWMASFPTEYHPTFFEVVTVMALRHFAEQKCDLVIWETGLGGRLDATNIVAPLASVITNVQRDHEKWLGNTIREIASEKAGIIKPGLPALTAAEDPEALAVIQSVARQQNSPLKIVTRDLTQLTPEPAALAGEHQRLNATLALATVDVLQSVLPVSEEAIQRGLSTVNWPGRLQLIQRPNGSRLLLDCAHNLDGAKALLDALQKNYPGSKPTLVLGILADKDWRHICDLMAPVASRILTVQVGSERAASAQELADACRAANPQAIVAACTSVAEALERSAQESFVVVAGSLYLVGEVMEHLNLTSETGSERALNEWGGVPHGTASSPSR